MATVRELLDELNTAKQTLTIWEEVKSHLAYFVAPAGEEAPEASLKMEDGVTQVDPDLIEYILTEIDSDIVSDLHKKIKKIEKMEVGVAGPGKKSKPARKSTRRTG